MEWSCQLLTLPEPVIQSMNFRRLSLPFESWLFLRLIMTVFKFKNPECHLHNQVGKRSNSNNFANLGNTEKFDVIKMIILLLVAFDSVLFSHMFSLASLSKITEILSLRLAEKTLEFCSVFHTRIVTRLSSPQVKYTCPVNWDLIFWLQETELLSMRSCRCFFHLEGVSRVQLNNAGKYQPSFNWLQPE